MIVNSVVDHMYECQFDGALITDLIETLQEKVDKYGDQAILSICYDSDDMLQFDVEAPREETLVEKKMRELREIEYEEGEKRLLAILKAKYPDN